MWRFVRGFLSRTWRRVRASRVVVRILEFVGIPVAAFVIGVVIGGLFIYGLHKKHWLGDKEPREPAAFSEVPEPQAGDLAERFRPWLKFDSRELWRPLNVSRLLEERKDGAAAHRFCKRPPAQRGCASIESAADFRRQVGEASALGRATYIDLAGKRLGEYGGRRCASLADCGGGPGSAIYYHVTESNDRFYIDYWWFLRFNNFYRSKPEKTCRSKAARDSGACDEHEGDWEGVTAVTPPGDDQKLDYVVYAAHTGTFRYAAAELGRHDERPDVYVARGSHASYPRRCEEKGRRKCDQPIAFEGLATLPESSFDGKDDWKRNPEVCTPGTPNSCLLPLPRTDSDPRAWTVWPGEWGAGCSDVCRGKPGPNSPRSPGLQARYQTPWCSTQGGVFTCDGRALKCSDWLGPLVAAAVCDPEVLANGLSDPSATQTESLAIKVRGEEASKETTPGVVQTLGAPLTAGENVTVRANGRRTQALLRAREGPFIVQARFDNLGLEEKETAVVSICTGHREPIILFGRAPVERRRCIRAAGAAQLRGFKEPVERTVLKIETTPQEVSP
jgi:hypothetical protein